MKKRFTRLLVIISSIVTIAAPLVIAAPAQAALFDGAAQQACKGVALDDAAQCDPNNTNAQSTVNRVLATALNLLSIIVGVAAVIMLIVSGLRLVMSQGESGNISSARSAIMYALIGLAIVALSQVLVRFVLTKTANTACPAGQVLVNNVCTVTP
jgi:hypothetical protein